MTCLGSFFVGRMELDGKTVQCLCGSFEVEESTMEFKLRGMDRKLGCIRCKECNQVMMNTDQMNDFLKIFQSDSCDSKNVICMDTP